MASIIILAILLATPLTLGILFRVGAPFLFFALLAGELLERYMGEEISWLSGLLTSDEMSLMLIRLGVILVPILLTAIFLRKSISGSKVFMHIIPYIATGIVLATFAAPLLTAEMQDQVRVTPLGSLFLDSTSMIVGIMVALQLVYLWIFNHHTVRKKRHK